MKKILCPVNFTDTALNAVEYACNMANLHGGTLTLYHVVTNEEYNQLLESSEGDFHEQIEEGSRDLVNKLNSLCQEIASSNTELHCQFKIGYGSLTGSVIDFAKKGNYDLIVMGNDGVNDVTQAMDGSSTVKVIEQAPSPVLCVPFQADFQGLQKIVYATEFREADREALHHLMLLLQPLGSQIEVVHILKSADKAGKEKAERKMEELKSYLNFNGVNYHLRESKENIRLGLDDFMEEIKGDMLVMLTHQRGFFERVFQKSNFKNMSYFADYPMLVYLEENFLK